MVTSDHLDSERKYFDAEATQLTAEDLRIPADQIERYRSARPGSRNLAKDELFARILPLEGKTVLDYGCGHGENSCLLAACGARVTGFDLSPVSVGKARERARLHGLEHLTQFDVKQAGDTGYPPATFDLVIGFAILHHLHDGLPGIAEEVARVLKPGGSAYFIEPTANSGLLRFLRRLVPLKAEATEDERQLRDADLGPFRRYFPSIEQIPFYNLVRLHRLIGERVAGRLVLVDYYLRRVMPWSRVFYGRSLIILRKAES
jgi:SAM-dependent methyltransferase